MKKGKVEQRFEKTYTQGAFNGMEIWVDKNTGVNYVFCFNGYAGGLTVLLDREGNPVITRSSELTNN